MAKILYGPEYPNGWPYAVDHVCGWCGTVYLLDPADVGVLECSDYVKSTCPSCGKSVTTYAPAPKRRPYAESHPHERVWN